MDIRNITKSEKAVLGKATGEYISTGKISQTCPRCGKPIVFEQEATWDITRCQDPACIGQVMIGI